MGRGRLGELQLPRAETALTVGKEEALRFGDRQSRLSRSSLLLSRQPEPPTPVLNEPDCCHFRVLDPRVFAILSATVTVITIGPCSTVELGCAVEDRSSQSAHSQRSGQSDAVSRLNVVPKSIQVAGVAESAQASRRGRRTDRRALTGVLRIPIAPAAPDPSSRARESARGQGPGRRLCHRRSRCRRFGEARLSRERTCVDQLPLLAGYTRCQTAQARTRAPSSCGDRTDRRCSRRSRLRPTPRTPIGPVAPGSRPRQHCICPHWKTGKPSLTGAAVHQGVEVGSDKQVPFLACSSWRLAVQCNAVYNAGCAVGRILAPYQPASRSHPRSSRTSRVGTTSACVTPRLRDPLRDRERATNRPLLSHLSVAAR